MGGSAHPLHPPPRSAPAYEKKSALVSLQSAFSLKIRLVLDLIQRDCKPRCRAYALVSRRKWLRRSRA